MIDVEETNLICLDVKYFIRVYDSYLHMCGI